MNCRIALALALCLLAPAWTSALEWKQTVIQQQASPVDEEARATFEFRNTSDRPVTITGVQTSCGCTVPELEKRLYAPGESGEVNVVFTFSSRVGLQHKTITIVTDESENSNYQLALEVDIPKLFTLDRYFVVWKRGEPVESKTIELTVHLPDKVKVTGVESKDKRFSASFEADDEPGSYRITITPASTDEVAQSSFQVTTNFPPNTPKFVTIYALVR